MKKILVPVDFSDLATSAAYAAAQIARQTEGWLYLLHVVPDGRSRSDAAQKREAEQNLEALLAHPAFESVNVTPIVHEKQLEGSLLEEARTREVDLIVMGSHGSGNKRVGSNTARVIRLSEIPVLVVKDQHDTLHIKNIVFASNFYGEVGAVFHHFLAFAELFDAKLHLLKVITPKNFETTGNSQRALDDFAKEHRLTNYEVHTYNHETKEEGILEFAEKLPADLVALTTHGRKGLSHFLLGSVAETVAGDSNIPVFSVKIPEIKRESGVLFPD